MKIKKGILITISAALVAAFAVVWGVTTWLHSNPFTTSQEVGYVLVFDPHTEDVAILTMKEDELQTLPFFESQRDAIEFSIKVEQEGYGLASVHAFYIDRILNACKKSEITCKRISAGSDISVPKKVAPVE